MKPDCARYETLQEQTERSADESRFMTEHLASCAECTALERALSVIALPPEARSPFPLDEVSARRMVNAVLEQSAPPVPRRSGRLGWALAAVAAVLLAIVVGVLLRRPPPAPSQVALPTPPKPPVVAPVPPPEAPMSEALVRVVVGDDERKPGQTLAEATALQIDDGSLGVTLGDEDAWMRAQQHTAFTLTHLRQRDYRVDLQRGHLDFHVKSGAGVKLQVHTIEGVVRVIGTVFSVDVSEKETRVVVLEGLVALDLRTEHVEIPGGSTYSTSARTTQKAMPAELASLEQTTAMERVVAQGEGQLSVMSNSRVSVDGVNFGEGPVRALLPLGRHVVLRSSSRGKPLRSVVPVSTTEAVIADPTPLRRTPKSNGGDGPGVGPGVGPGTISPEREGETDALLAKAQAARTRKDWPAAARAYEEIIRSPGPMVKDLRAAEVARLSLGQLQVDHLGAPKEGEALCRSYVDRNPSGPLVAEATLCRIRAFERLKQPENELMTIDAFLQKWPDDFNAPRLGQRRLALQGK